MIKKGLKILLFLLVSYQVSSGQENKEKTEYITVVNDSALSHDKAFYYMQDLDSLLHVVNHEADSLAHLKQGQRTAPRNRAPLFGGLLHSPVVQILFWVILAGFVLFIFYKLFNFNIFSGSQKDSGATEILETNELKLPGYYNQEIAAAEKSGNYMLAIRYRFLETLALLNERGWITFLPEKTNAAYESEIRSEGLKKDFREIALIYDYVWYGENKITSEQYDSIKPIFAQTNSQT